MTVHLKKLSVGTESLESLRTWQTLRLENAGRLMHVTRNWPRRSEEILNGGSIYWIIKGVMTVRQRIVDFVCVQRADGCPACGLILDPELVATEPIKIRIFQGWRYLEIEDAPNDLSGKEDSAFPAALSAELRELGIF